MLGVFRLGSALSTGVWEGVVVNDPNRAGPCETH